ncbi:MAG: glycosyltransferase family 4 protein [Candidatus Odinarchaeum yellowstonii]|uniref:Glycosyltransferase family 4 protein n=1 Tax=Odinarchaeota yellowstonii (strain LCB_4) TaxID=1841599 RepID=A0AAF0IB23_ODILC|nr:MAG: glycosyltransferase family 4 protein [Candidatus Odinarchaeum yellowstonii]
MKILQVSAYPPGRYGGSERFAIQLSERLAKKGHEVTLITSNFDKQVFYEKVNGVKVYRYKCINNLWNVNPLTVIFPKLLREGDKYDVVHAHGHIFFTSNQVALVKKIKKYKYVLHLHGGIIPEPNSGGEKRFLVKKWVYDPTIGRFTVNTADIIASVSKCDIENAIRIFSCDPEKFVWIPPAVDTKRFFNNHNSNNNVNNITFIGRLEPWKGADLFINIAKKIYKLNPNIRFTVVGDGSLKYELIKSAAGYPIRFLGAVQHENIPDILSESTVLILPSRLEGLPTVCIEALACGVPVIASDVGGVCEVIDHGRTGFIFNLNELDKAVEYTMSLVNNPDLKMKMGLAGSKIVEKMFSWDEITRRVEELYKRLI